MKRLILLIFVVMLAYWILARHSSTLAPPAGTAHRNSRLLVHNHDATRHFVTQTGQGVEQTINNFGQAVHQAVGGASEKVKDKFDEICEACLGDDDDVAVAQSGSAHGRSSVVEREEAEGIPVPIVPGTRVTEAQPVPPVPPRRAAKARRAAAAARPEPKVVVKIASPENFAPAIPSLAGPISATPERADAAARKQLREEIIAWLEPDVPSTWSLPGRELDQLVIQSNLESVVKESLITKDDPGPMFITHLTLDTTPARRERLVKLYNRELVGRRLVKLGGGLGFILMCLAAVSGYIRADEASRGYYTNRLRLLAAAGIGAGGVLIYQMIA